MITKIFDEQKDIIKPYTETLQFINSFIMKYKTEGIKLIIISFKIINKFLID